MIVSPRRRQIVVFALVAVGTVFLYLVRGILFPFWVAAVLAYVSNPLVREVEKRDVPRHVAIILVYLILVIGIILLGYYIVPRLVHEMETVLLVLPKQTQELSRFGNNLLSHLESINFPIDFSTAVDQGIDRVETFLNGFLGRMLDLVIGMFSHLFGLFLAPVVGYYILRDWEQLAQMAVALIPVAHRSDVKKLVGDIDEVLSGFIRGQLIVSALVGAAVAAALALVLKVRFALLLGLWAGIFNIIPYFGPVIGAIPAVALALLDSAWKAVWVVVLFVVVNNVESAFLTPRIVGQEVGLHPLLLIFSVLAFGHLFGVLGMLLAVPVVAVSKILLVFFFKNFF